MRLLSGLPPGCGGHVSDPSGHETLAAALPQPRFFRRWRRFGCRPREARAAGGASAPGVGGGPYGGIVTVCRSPGVGGTHRSRPTQKKQRFAVGRDDLGPPYPATGKIKGTLVVNGHHFPRRGGAYPKGTGSTDCSFFAGPTAEAPPAAEEARLWQGSGQRFMA